MRNVLPLVSLGCMIIFLVGVLAGGAVMLAYGLNGYFSKDSSTAQEKHNPELRPLVEPQVMEKRTLLQAREGHTTVLKGSRLTHARQQPKTLQDADLIAYRSSVGPEGGFLSLAAYLSKAPKDQKIRPAVIWVHDGFDGIDPETWRQAKVFDDECILMCPSFREENANNGQFSMFYNEVGDLLAAVNHVSALPFVDKNRIYIVGHGTGGTLALLAATTGTKKVRAFFAIGGTPDVEEALRAGGMKIAGQAAPFVLGPTPDAYVRSAIHFVGSIQSKTFYFEAKNQTLPLRQALEMQAAAKAKSISFHVYAVPGANVSTLVAPVAGLISEKIAGDDKGPFTTIDFTPKEIETLFTR